MIGLPNGTRIWLAAGATDMRKSFDGLAAHVQTKLHEDAFSGHVFVFRGRKGDHVRILWWSGDGLCMFAKRLEQGKFVWPQASTGLSRKGAPFAGVSVGLQAALNFKTVGDVPSSARHFHKVRSLATRRTFHSSLEETAKGSAHLLKSLIFSAQLPILPSKPEISAWIRRENSVFLQ